MNRRRFLASGLGAIAATAASRASAGQSTAGPNTGVDFDFTGLYAFRFAKAKKEMRVLLLNSKETKLNDNHVPMLMMPLEAWHYIPPADKGHIAPTVIRLGDKAMAVWSLISTRLWVFDAHKKFDDADTSPNLAWDESAIGDDPVPIDKDEGWASLKWFVGFRQLLGGKYELNNKPITLKSQKKLTTEIRLTRGYSGGRAPQLACERYRKYRLGTEATVRTYASQMHVAYAAGAGVLNLALTDINTSGLGYTLIGVKVASGSLTPISILNVPVTHGHTPHHYTAFYNMVDANGKMVTATNCMESPKARAFGSSLPSSPDPDCIPPSWPDP